MYLTALLMVVMPYGFTAGIAGIGIHGTSKRPRLLVARQRQSLCRAKFHSFLIHYGEQGCAILYILSGLKVKTTLVLPELSTACM